MGHHLVLHASHFLVLDSVCHKAPSLRDLESVQIYIQTVCVQQVVSRVSGHQIVQPYVRPLLESVVVNGNDWIKVFPFL
jgi:hypothetical protein